MLISLRSATPVALMVIVLLGAVAGCEQDPADRSVREILTAHATPLSQLDAPDRVRLKAVGSTAHVDAGGPLDAPDTLDVMEPADWHAHLDERRLRAGQGVVAAARYALDDDGRLQVTACRDPLLGGPQTVAHGLDTEVVWHPQLEPTPGPAVARRLASWVASCEAEPNGAQRTLFVQEMARAPFLAAWWPGERLLLVHPLLLEMVVADAAPTTVPRPLVRQVNEARALTRTEFDTCVTDIVATCSPCTLPDLDDESCYQSVAGVGPTSARIECREIVSQGIGAYAAAACACQYACESPPILECLRCADVELPEPCALDPIETDAGFIVEEMSQLRTMSDPRCVDRLAACVDGDRAETTCELAESRFGECLADTRALCEACLGAGTAETPEGCEPLFERSSLVQDCVDLGYPGFEDSAALNMYCAWQSPATASCINARHDCVHGDVEVVSFDTLVLAYQALIATDTRQVCLEQVLDCDQGMGIDPLPPADAEPPWDVPAPSGGAGDDDGVNCGG